MKIETRLVLRADEGMVLTDGNTYGRVVMLGEGRNENDFREITDEEYKAIMALKEAEESSVTDTPDASEIEESVGEELDQEGNDGTNS
jgi:hypothetical protein